jgi:hypothetical protein
VLICSPWESGDAEPRHVEYDGDSPQNSAVFSGTRGRDGVLESLAIPTFFIGSSVRRIRQ